MKRSMDVLWPVIGLGAAVLCGWGLAHELHGLSLAEVGGGFSRIAPRDWALALASTLVAYAALAWYDQIALMHLGRRLAWPFVALTSFTAYSIGHNIGASVLSSAIVRYRAYSSRGLSTPEIGMLVAFCSLTFVSGTLLLAGVVLLIEPRFVGRIAAAASGSGRLIAVALLLPPWAYVLGALLHFRPLKFPGFEVVYPRPPIAARQMLAGPIEIIGAAGIIYFALPADHNPGYLIVLAAFLASFSLALISHAPGGLGVLELTFLKLVPEAPRADLIVGVDRVPAALSHRAARHLAGRGVCLRTRAPCGAFRLEQSETDVNAARKAGGADVLIVTDVQRDFLPGGALAVPGGDEILPIVHTLVEAFDFVMFTQDWHPAGHASFASSHIGRRPFETVRLAYGDQRLWPDHCVQGSPGAALHEDLNLDRASLILRKGMNPDINSYSAFVEADGRTSTGLAALLQARGVGHVFLAGLATDFCVAYSALDARAAGFETLLIEDACRGIDAEGSLAAAHARMAEAGVTRIPSSAIL